MIKAMLSLSQHTLQVLSLTVPLETHFPLTQSEISHYTQQGKELRQKLLVSVLEVWHNYEVCTSSIRYQFSQRVFSSFVSSAGSVGRQRSIYLSDLSKPGSSTAHAIRADIHCDLRSFQYFRLSRGARANGA